LKYCSINNEIKLEEEAFVSINERGFLFGDGVFETCLLRNKKLYNFSSHLARLTKGLKAIKISFDSKNLEININELIKINNLEQGLIRIYISRGIGSIGYKPIENIEPLLVIQTKDLPPKPPTSIKLSISDIKKISPKSLPVDCKLAQGLNSTLVKIQAQENGYFDAIMLNNLNDVCETSSANIFWSKNNILYTPSSKCGILIGTTRNKIIDLSHTQVKQVEAKIEDLSKADEVFITNISYGVLKVDEIHTIDQKFTKDGVFKSISTLLENDIQKTTA
jgi:branched-chain amino acid aminotransferase